MEQNLIISNEIIIISLLLVAIIASLTLRHLKLPYTIGLVLIGYVFSAYIVPHVDVLKPIGPYFPAVDIILYIFLPPLIFESAIEVNTRLFNRNLFPILSLAIVGVIISAGIIGYMVSWYFAIPLLFALLFGALISSTDPVAVISIFKEIGVLKRLQIFVEGESLLNDASSIILFQLVLLLISKPLLKNNLTFLETSALFTSQLLTSCAGGIIVGIIGGILLRIILQKAPIHIHIHQTATLVAAYLTYLVSDELGFSGVIAVVVCGFITARAASDWIGPDRREELKRFWEYIGFLANSLIFLLVGITIATLKDFSILLKNGIFGILFLIGAVLLARFIPVIGTFTLSNRFTRHKVPLSYQMICFWGGLRGAVAIALVLSIPLSLPFRDLIIAWTVIAVLFSIFIQGLSIGPLIRVFRLGQSPLIRTFYQFYRDITTSRAAKSALESSSLAGITDPDIFETCLRMYDEKIQNTEQNLQEFWDEVHKNPDRMSVISLFWLEALHYEEKTYRQLYDDGLIPPPVYAELQYQT
ncbi:MAG TPA: sodium:proton antiporter, partial [Methanospirillum sp.]|uniref:cation:proton antiporter n=1 Tax=Methanospirillum sp. TaxID=45200 RepID=UPI002C3AA820